MRVTLVHSYYASGAPSGENVAVDLQAQALRRAGLDVSLVAVHTDNLRARPAYGLRTVVSVALRAGIDPRPQIHATSPDVVHVHNLFPNFSPSWLSSWEGPVVATFHNFRPMCASGVLARGGQDCYDCLGRPFPWPAVRHACYRGSRAATLPVALSIGRGVRDNPLVRRADKLVFITPRAIENYRRAGLPLSDRVELVPNFVEDPRDVHDSSAGTWLFAGRLSRQKGILELVQSWPADVPLDIYGDGELRQQVAEYESSSVTYRGPVARDQLLELMPRHRGLVFSSMSAEGGLPFVYLEAMAAGLPTAALRGNAVADDVAEGGAGAVFSDFRDLGRALAMIEKNAESLSQRARDRFRENFSEDAWVYRMIGVYERAIDARGEVHEKRRP